MTRKLLAFVCAPALLFAANANAQAYDNRYEERVVQFGDLNLESRSGADTLIRRIQLASEVVCGDRPGPRPLSENTSVNNCETETTEYAVQEIGHPNVLYRYYGYMPEVVIEGSWDPDADPYYEVKPKY
jgi:UrcA family protein